MEMKSKMLHFFPVFSEGQSQRGRRSHHKDCFPEIQDWKQGDKQVYITQTHTY